ncbi:MAG TPA: hypothetical protein VJY43_02855 [Methanocorpusculum sp.]|nr:hypothetical protein [Methanocorpusculum sp.]
MAIRYKKTNQRQKRFVMAMFLSMAVIIILIGSFFAALFGTSYMIDTTLDDPDVLLHVSIVGDDVIVDIYGGRRVDELAQLSMHIDGFESKLVIDVPQKAENVVYHQAASGVTGSRGVEVRGIFRDGTTKVLVLSTLKFT